MSAPKVTRWVIHRDGDRPPLSACFSDHGRFMELVVDGSPFNHADKCEEKDGYGWSGWLVYIGPGSTSTDTKVEARAAMVRLMDEHFGGRRVADRRKRGLASTSPGNAVTATTRSEMHTCEKHEDREAVAAVVITDVADPVALGYVCKGCAECVSPGCEQVGVVLDKEYEEAWCQPHADQYTGEEAVSGPSIVLLDSREARDLGLVGG